MLLPLLLQAVTFVTIVTTVTFVTIVTNLPLMVSCVTCVTIVTAVMFLNSHSSGSANKSLSRSPGVERPVTEDIKQWQS